MSAQGGPSKAVFPRMTQSVGSVFPLVNPVAPAADTFEIGLVLGGTVSAAAYTAGVIDFLIQALDAWTVARKSGTAPDHKVLFKIAAGTSGGAITCVLLTRILGYEFPHCDETSSPTLRAENPLYNCWVNEIDITDMLKTTDVKDGNIPSLLCADKITQVGIEIQNYRGSPLGTTSSPAIRDYFDQLLPVILTTTNLRGIPYSTDFKGDSGRPEFYTDYADHIRFRVDITGKNPPTVPDLAPYEIAISESASGQVQPWSTIIQAARCSSAFPVGLPSQSFSRPLAHYRYNYAVIDDGTSAGAIWLYPAWDYMVPNVNIAGLYEFPCVDGGCFNNEPTEYARQALAGVLGHNDRTATGAHRAVLLVDPFADTPKDDLTAELGVLAAGSATLSAFTGGARYETADLELFTSEAVFSRFLINPVRTDSTEKTLTGGDAVATNSLMAFGGFLSLDFRNHDFMLGRRNCQQFLRTAFVLDEKNTLFTRWTKDQRNLFGKDVPGFLPVIPLVGALANPIPQPDWPKNRFDPNAIKIQISDRLKSLVAAAAKSDSKLQSWPWSWLLYFISRFGESWVAGKAVDTISAALQKADLLDVGKGGTSA